MAKCICVFVFVVGPVTLIWGDLYARSCAFVYLYLHSRLHLYLCVWWAERGASEEIFMLGLVDNNVVQQRTPDCTFNYTALLQCASTLSVHCTLYSQPEYMQVEHLSGRVEHHLVLLCICCTAFLPKPSVLHCVAIMHLGRSSVRKLQAV